MLALAVALGVIALIIALVGGAKEKTAVPLSMGASLGTLAVILGLSGIAKPLVALATAALPAIEQTMATAAVAKAD